MGLRFSSSWLLAVGLIAFLAACQPGAASEGSTPTAIRVTATAARTPSPLPSPTWTPSPPPSPTPTVTQPRPTPTPRLTEQGVLPPGALNRLGKGTLYDARWDATGQRYLVLAGRSLYLYTAEGQLQQIVPVPEGLQQAGFLDESQVLLAGPTAGLVRLDLTTQEVQPLSLPQRVQPTVLTTHPGLSQALIGAESGQVFWWTAEGSWQELPQGVQNPVTALLLSPRGSLAVAGYQDGTVLLWSLMAPDQPPLALRGHTEAVLALTFPPLTPPLLITAGADRQVLAWDVTARRLVRTYPIVDAAVSALDVSWQGDLLLGGTVTGDLLVWDLSTALLGQRIPKYHQGRLQRVDLQPVGNLALTVGVDGQLTVFDLGLRTAVLQDASYSLNVRSAAWHPTQDLVALGTASGQILLWNPTTGQRVRVLQGHQSEVSSLAFSADGAYLASADLDGRVFVWDTNRWTQIYYRFYGPGLIPVEDLTFAPDNAFVAGVGWTNLYIWDLETEENLFVLVERATLHSLAMHPSGLPIAVGTNDGRVLLWDYLRWDFVGEKIGPQQRVEALAYAPQGERLVGITQKQLFLWGKAPEPELELSLPFLGEDVVYLSQNRILVAGQGWALLDLETQQWFDLPLGFGDRVREVHLGPQGARVLTVARDGSVLVWDLRSLAP